jgi:hypothetical protein
MVPHRLITAAAAAATLAASGMAQVVLTQEDFEVGDGNGWLANGVPTIFDFDEGNPGKYMGVPYLDFWGVSLRHENPAALGVGDLTQHRTVTLSVDVRVFQLRNFFEEDMNPAWFPFTLQLVDIGDPENFEDNASVYFTGAGLPQVADGWATFTWTIEDTGATELPPGWGGTGAEDPVDFHPILPPGRTFTDVLASIDEIYFTTMQPGYFYGASYWEMGFDNVLITAVDGTPCNIADMDASGDLDLNDFFAFLNCFDQTLPCADIDGVAGVDLGDFFGFLGAFDAGC